MASKVSLIYPLDAVVLQLREEFRIDDTSIRNGFRNADRLLDYTLSLYGIPNSATHSVAQVMKLIYVAYFNQVVDDFELRARKAWNSGRDLDTLVYRIDEKTAEQLTKELPHSVKLTPEQYLKDVKRICKSFARRDKTLAHARNILAEIPEPDPSMVAVYANVAANANAGTAVKRVHYREH